MAFTQRRKLYRALEITGIIVIAVLFFYQCPFRAILGIPCPGCGMTRALVCLLHGDLKSSLYYHPMLIFTGLAALAGLYALIRKKRKLLTGTLTVWCVLMIALYVWRMAVYFPFEPMQANPNGLIFRLLNLAGVSVL